MHSQSSFAISFSLCCVGATHRKGNTAADHVNLDVQSHACAYLVWINCDYTYYYLVASAHP